ncbi:type II secretion system protein GspL [Wenzhouxiangella marina]|uniref:Type II secretion system protein L n=1 Tax=Wenzhouxiangella marina TaxID=1579979 RepID=A0A0K0XTA3_9GAMM|nr:type II secretion system protein GspL [Wenzhouxiangella marina]AKS40944.1 hypothetical protein WM2015_562 [Wenzhouxiangella marina]MBB6087818.1 general secretion pathway protein L [Wenzhouxiangella marina]
MASSAKEQVLVHAAGDRWSWRVLDRAGRVRSEGASAPEQADWPKDLPVHVLVDAAHCIGLRLDLPPMSAARQAKALRWAAEEHLASSAEDEHVVAGPRDAEQRLCCVVIGQARMSELMGRFEPLAVEQLVPDALCLPWAPGQITLASFGDRVLARWGDWDFGSFEPDLVADLLSTLDPEATRVWYGEALPALADDAGIEHRPDEPLQVLVQGLKAVPINLLSGPFASGSARAARSYWRYAAAAAVAAMVLAFAHAVVELELLESRAAELAGELDAQFAAAFPGVTPAGRHREQAERQLSRLRYGEAAGLLDLMNQAAPVIAGQPGLVLEAMSFREGRLEFQLRAPDVAGLEALARRFRDLDLRAEVQSASLEADGASGRLLLTSAGGA